MSTADARFAGYRDRHRGETVIVCGCGVSLRELRRPERFVTIGVNDVGRLFTPDYLIVVNERRQFTAERYAYVETSGAKAVFSQLAVAHPRLVRFRLGRRAGTGRAADDCLDYTNNSPYVAISLARYMGAARIGVIGVDFENDHFFGRTGRHPLTGQLARIDREYGALAAACRDEGIELANLSPVSRLTSLPRASLDEWLGDGEPVAARPCESASTRPAAAHAVARRVFFVHYRFLSCGTVFETGLREAAATLSISAEHAYWDDALLPQKVDRFRPDLLFVVHGRRFVQRWCRFPNVRSAVWLLDEPYEVDDTSRWSRAFDTVFVNDPSTISRHVNAHPLPVCFDPRLHCDSSGVRDYDVGFIGGHNPVREQYLVRLAEAGLLSYVVGGPWQASCLKRFTIVPRTTSEETARLYQRTKIVINVFRSVHHFNREAVCPTSLNPRVFEALACGALIVSESRPALAAMFPDVPTFQSAEELTSAIRALLDDPGRLQRLLDDSRARLTKHDYAARLEEVIAVTMAETRPVEALARAVEEPAWAPDRWETVGRPIITRDGEDICLAAEQGRESGFASSGSFEAVRLAFDLWLDEHCHFIAKIHCEAPAEPRANSYHLIATPRVGHLARHSTVLAPLQLARGRWQRVEIAWSGGELRLAIDGREICRRPDASLASGRCFVGVTNGRATIRNLALDVPPPPAPLTVHGWTIRRGGRVTPSPDGMILAAAGAEAATLVSDSTANDVEVEFMALVDRDAHFIAKIHHQSPEDPDANSYHLVCTPAHGYLARHTHVFAEVRIPRRTWCQIRLRWVDQCLELYINGRRTARVADHLLQSGLSVISVTAGELQIRGLALRDLSAAHAPASSRVHPNGHPRPGLDVLPFTAPPARNLLYHVWPVRGQMWRWNVKQLLTRIDLFNGRRIVGIVQDDRSEHPDEVQRMFDGHGCRFVVARNGPAAEGVTFPGMLEAVRSLDPNEVTFYAHAKGVKYEPSVPEPVRRWAETQYRVALDDWLTVRTQLQHYAMTGSFKMQGRFRVHQYLGDWHYSGTFFWLRHAFVFARDLRRLGEFYGCVEAWPGINFRRDETGCLFMDDLRQLPYHQEFWTVAEAELAAWSATRAEPLPPDSLQAPAPFEGFEVPRLEQQPEEFAWFLDRLVEAQPRSLLCIGSMHGGVEWHVARRFRALGRDIRITAVDEKSRPELLASLDDARRQFAQLIDLVVGDSAAAATRDRLGPQYDAVFVDGDHGYRGAHNDVEFSLTRGPRLVALHDIADSDWHAQAGCCVSRVWSELCARYPVTEERIVGEWGGIGIIMLRSQKTDDVTVQP